MDISKFLKKVRQTHVEWATYYLKYPWTEDLPENKNAGDLARQQVYVREYDTVIEQIIELQDKNKRYEKALERSISGEAFWVGGCIPEEFLSEWKCRCKFTKLILKGKSVKEAMKIAVAEQDEIHEDYLSDLAKQARLKAKKDKIISLRKEADSIEQDLKGKENEQSKNIKKSDNEVE